MSHKIGGYDKIGVYDKTGKYQQLLVADGRLYKQIIECIAQLEIAVYSKNFF